MPNPTAATDARARLKAAAASAFAAKGFHATTTRDIASAAGMSPAAVYVHHASKESLLHELSLEGHRETLDLVRAAVASAPSPAGQLRALVHAWVLLHAERHAVSRIVNYELDGLSAEHRSEVDGVRREITGVFRDVVERGVAAGELRADDTAMTVAALVSLGADVARWWADDRSWRPAQLADHFTTLAMRMVRPD